MGEKLDFLYKELVVKNNRPAKEPTAVSYEFVFDLRGNFLSVTPEAAEFSGYSVHDIENMSVWDVISEQDHELVLEKFAARKEGRPVDPYEVTLITKAKKAIRIRVETIPIVENGKVLHIRGKFTPL